MSDKLIHTPVMLEEIISFLRLKDGMVIVDGTIGTGGHAIEIVKRISPNGKLIGIDRDDESLNIAKERLIDYSNQCIFVHDNFSNVDNILNSQGIRYVDGVLLDLGISSFQLDNPERGFSFSNEGPLDMRMDRNNSISAFDLINNLTQKEISSILWNFGQERFSNRIAKMIINHRNQSPINTTIELSNLILKAVPHSKRYYHIHPATRTFQALRIAVNHELDYLELFLKKIATFMNKKARICIISFHSLEDRITKINFLNLAKTSEFTLIVKKPISPNQQESKNNPRSRSAKLRVLERL